ncbi:MAG: sigma-70 family RNA polymerase sigma factor [Myxococcaceae bacterium]|nr:MAG: sigma-70 family RNA polymerase sigma factor [Myxococcaceae bacterium]
MGGGNGPASTGVWVGVTTLLSSWLPSPAALGSMLAERTETVPYRAEVRAARRGDRSAFEALVRSVQRPIYGLCLRLLRTEAEAAEVAQETFLRAYQHLGRYDESKPFDLWVLAIARNLCLDLLRRRSRVHTQDVDEMHESLPSGERSQEEGVIAAEEHRSLETALSTLGADDREVLALYYVQKRTTKEIALVMGVAPGTIMARLFRAREKLRRQMTTEDAQ